jgi:hypothetical protein
VRARVGRFEDEFVAWFCSGWNIFCSFPFIIFAGLAF